MGLLGGRERAVERDVFDGAGMGRDWSGVV